jgi:hypothetical protein
MKIAKSNNKTIIKLTQHEWYNLGKIAGWIDENDSKINEENNEQNYQDLYKTPVPKDFYNGKLIKTYQFGQHAEIERYDNGYFVVVNLVHGTNVLYTKNWKIAKDRATEIKQQYQSY